MIDIQPDLLCARLALEFLQSPGSVAAGVPDQETLPSDIMDSGKKRKYPSLIVAAKEESFKGAGRKITVCPMIITWLKSSDENAAPVEEQTTRLQASQWLRQIDARLQDSKAFGAWVKTLPVERRTGWRFLALPRAGGDFPPLYARDSANVTYGLTQTWYVVIGPSV